MALTNTHDGHQVVLDPLPPSKTLEMLVLRSNMLTLVPFMPHAAALVVLDLASNQITRLDSACCRALKALLLGSNAITAGKCL
jgi:hypothetical protein